MRPLEGSLTYFVMVVWWCLRSGLTLWREIPVQDYQEISPDHSLNLKDPALHLVSLPNSLIFNTLAYRTTTANQSVEKLRPR